MNRCDSNNFLWTYFFQQLAALFNVATRRKKPIYCVHETFGQSTSQQEERNLSIAFTKLLVNHDNQSNIHYDEQKKGIWHILYNISHRKWKWLWYLIHSTIMLLHSKSDYNYFLFNVSTRRKKPIYCVHETFGLSSQSK